MMPMSAPKRPQSGVGAPIGAPKVAQPSTGAPVGAPKVAQPSTGAPMGAPKRPQPVQSGMNAPKGSNDLVKQLAKKKAQVAVPTSKQPAGTVDTGMGMPTPKQPGSTYKIS